MAKKKLQRFAEMEGFPNVIQPAFDDVFGRDHRLRGNWIRDQFGRPGAVVLELGCGKGEYTIGLAQRYPERNFVGADIKGARIWRGAKTALEEKLGNVAFLRTRIEQIASFFGPGEVDEIWLTFPDPQLKKGRKRLSSSRFLNAYKQFLKDGGRIHLKTDSTVLHRYTLSLARHNDLKVLIHTEDLYHSEAAPELLGIQTYYERQFLAQGMKITYLCFELPHEKTIEEPPEA
jgi:tRNA (guanine-N7-)-methyltransferase